MKQLVKQFLDKVEADPNQKYDTTEIQLHSFIQFAKGLGYEPRTVDFPCVLGAVGFQLIWKDNLKYLPSFLSFEDMLSLHNGSHIHNKWKQLGFTVDQILKADSQKIVEYVGLYRLKKDKKIYTNKVYIRFTEEAKNAS